MAGRRSLGWGFGWFWAAYASSAFGTRLAFGAFPLIAIVVLEAGATDVSLLAAAGLAVGAAVAVPLGAWVEFRRKRRVMVAMDLVRFAAMMSVPAAFALGRLGFAQLLVVSVVVAAADITSKAAAGACLKALVRPDDLLVANGRLESTTWTAAMVGPPLGGAAIGLLGPVTTVVADAVSYLLSALALLAMGRGRAGGREEAPVRTGTPRPRAADLLDGWRFILTHPGLRRLFLNSILVNGLIMATVPLLAVLMLGDLGFAPWQYGLAFALPCIGGLVGARLAGPLVTRFGRHPVLVTSGALRACWLVGLAFVHPGVSGLVLVILVELALITCMGVFNPVFATYRLDQLPTDQVVRTLSAWSVTGNATIAGMTALWGLLAHLTSARAAIAVAGLLVLTTPLLLPRPDRAPEGPPVTDGAPSASGS